MSVTLGKLITCCRCSCAIFLKHTGTATLDGGYTKYDEFEERPKSWIYDTHIGHLCPDCAEEFYINMKYFLGHDNFAPGWKPEKDISCQLTNLRLYMIQEVVKDDC